MDENIIISVQGKREEIISCFSQSMKNYFSNIPLSLLEKSEFELEELFTPTTIDWAIRRKMWELFEQINAGVGEDIGPVDLYDGICSKQNFFFFLKNPIRLAWVSIIPTAYNTLQDRGFYLGLTKVVNYIQKTPVDAKNLSVFLKLIEQFANRVIGPVTQRVETKNLSVNIHQTEDISNPESVNKKLQELKTKLLEEPKQDIIDVE